MLKTVIFVETVIHFILYLDSQDAKDDKKGTADENYVSYRFQRSDQSLHNQFEARSSTDNPVTRENNNKRKPFSICRVIN